MKLTKIKKSICTAITVLMAAASIPTMANAADDYQDTGNIGGFDWEVWNQESKGNFSWEPSAGSFTCSWSGIENFLARMGKNYDKQKKNYKAFGDIVLSYDVEYTPKGNSYMCIYGWTRSPLMEYYIVEGWGDWRPPGNEGESKGSVTIDGNTYDILKSRRYNKPSIEGTQTFDQYWSVRRTSGSANNKTNNMKGTVSVTKHFEAWEKAGLDMSGTLYEVSLNIEGYKSNGSAKVKSISFDKADIVPEPVIEPIKPDANGYYLKEKFEDGTGDWAGRGDAAVKSSSEGYDGSKGLFVSGRTEEWNGASIALDSNTFKAGETYSFGVNVKQLSGSATPMKLTLQYTDSDGKETYDTVAEKSASDEWIDLSNSSYTIPEGASNLILYVEAPKSLTDFYIDNAYAGVKGTKPLVIPSSTVKPSDDMRGDTNEDGVVDVYDLIRLRKGIIDMASGTGTVPPNSDVNGDGDTSVADLVCLQKHILGSSPIPAPTK